MNHVLSGDPARPDGREFDAVDKGFFFGEYHVRERERERGGTKDEVCSDQVVSGYIEDSLAFSQSRSVWERIFFTFYIFGLLDYDKNVL